MIKIYKLIDPRDNTIKYIGKTKQNDIKKRLNGHIRMSLKNSSTKKEKWICSLLSKGLSPIIEIVEECFEYNWEEREIHWINYYSEIYNLTNSTIGGDGVKDNSGIKNGMFGKKHKKSSKEKMSMKAKERRGVKNSRAKKIYQYSLNGEFIRSWNYCKKASDYFNISPGNLSSAAKHNSINNIDFFKVRSNFIFSFKKVDKIENVIIHKNAKRFIENEI